MGVRIECDWCHQKIDRGDPYVTVEFDGCVRRGASAIEPLLEQARVYCGADRYTDEDPAANATFGIGDRASEGWWHRDSCFTRALAALTGNPVGRADIGLEWRLVASPAPSPDYLLDADVDAMQVGEPVRAALRQAGVARVREVALLTHAELIAIPGIGHRRADAIRQSLHHLVAHQAEKRIKKEGATA